MNIPKFQKILSEKCNKETLSYLLVGFLLLFSLFTRLYNLEETGTFFWDPAYDLRQMYQYYLDKRITLVGPISEEGNKVFSSLTYYLLLPFAVMGNFDATSTTYGASLYGWLTALLIVFLSYKLNKKLLVPVALLVSIWFPLLETSRWAWNPNLATLWITAALISFQYHYWFMYFITGLLMGLSIHQHYVAVAATGMFALLSWFLIPNKKVVSMLNMAVGYCCALLPFVIFDLLRPPGLFITRVLYFNQVSQTVSTASTAQKIAENFSTVLQYYTHSTFLSAALVVTLSTLIYFDCKYQKKNLIFLFCWLIQIVAIAFIEKAHTHYFLPGLLFFMAYLIIERKSVAKYASFAGLAILIVGSLFTVKTQLTTNEYANPAWQPNIRTVKYITSLLKKTIHEKNLQGVNLAVLGSPDPNRYGWKYRSLLEIEGVTLMSKYEYFTNSYLFVLSQGTEQELRNDPSPEMHNFRNEKLVDSWVIPDSNWHLYLFSY